MILIREARRCAPYCTFAIWVYGPWSSAQEFDPEMEVAVAVTRKCSFFTAFYCRMLQLLMPRCFCLSAGIN